MGSGGREVVLRQRLCRYGGCGRLFYICRSCDRGHAYCSVSCRLEGQRRWRSEVNRRYQQSREARRDHADRQREYRRRRAEQFVTDPGSPGSVEVSTLDEPVGAPDVPAGGVGRRRSRPFDHPGPACVVWGRGGMVDPEGGTHDRRRPGRPDSPALLRRTLEAGDDRGRAGAACGNGEASADGHPTQRATAAPEPGRPVPGIHRADAAQASPAARHTAVPDDPGAWLLGFGTATAPSGRYCAPGLQGSLPAPAQLSWRAGSGGLGPLRSGPSGRYGTEAERLS